MLSEEKENMKMNSLLQMFERMTGPEKQDFIAAALVNERKMKELELKRNRLMGLFMDVIDQRIETPDNGDCWWCGGSGVDPNGLTSEYECRVCKTWYKEIL